MDFGKTRLDVKPMLYMVIEYFNQGAAVEIIVAPVTEAANYLPASST